jgi:hypothetical protein
VQPLIEDGGHSSISIHLVWSRHLTLVLFGFSPAMLSSTTLAYCFVWASVAQHISAGGSNSYAAWSHPYGDYQDGWDSISSAVVVKPSSVWQETSSSWSTTTAVASGIFSIESPITQSTIATPLPHSASNWNVSDQSASASKTGTALTSHASSTTGNTVTYDWKLEWMIAAPDGVARPVIGVNGQWYVYSRLILVSGLTYRSQAMPVHRCHGRRPCGCKRLQRSG